MDFFFTMENSEDLVPQKNLLWSKLAKTKTIRWKQNLVNKPEKIFMINYC